MGLVTINAAYMPKYTYIYIGENVSCHASDGRSEGSKNPQQNQILKGICNCMPKVENFHEIRDWKENTWELHDGLVIITRLELHLEKMGSSPFISPPAQYHPHILFPRCKCIFKIPPPDL